MTAARHPAAARRERLAPPRQASPAVALVLLAVAAVLLVLLGLVVVHALAELAALLSALGGQ